MFRRNFVVILMVENLPNQGLHHPASNMACLAGKIIELNEGLSSHGADYQIVPKHINFPCKCHQIGFSMGGYDFDGISPLKSGSL